MLIAKSPPCQSPTPRRPPPAKRKLWSHPQRLPPSPRPLPSLTRPLPSPCPTQVCSFQRCRCIFLLFSARFAEPARQGAPPLGARHVPLLQHACAPGPGASPIVPLSLPIPPYCPCPQWLPSLFLGSRSYTARCKLVAALCPLPPTRGRTAAQPASCVAPGCTWPPLCTGKWTVRFPHQLRFRKRQAKGRHKCRAKQARTRERTRGGLYKGNRLPFSSSSSCSRSSRLPGRLGSHRRHYESDSRWLPLSSTCEGCGRVQAGR